MRDIFLIIVTLGSIILAISYVYHYIVHDACCLSCQLIDLACFTKMEIEGVLISILLFLTILGWWYLRKVVG